MPIFTAVTISASSIAVRAISDTEFYVNGGDHTRISFITAGSGKIAGAVLNPGPERSKESG